ncbi:hypothetical protein Pint_28718 [Pistacia integerrima]|uniref:Uncharacterized protein n=1 Tax=Pistacia integerrima TaxID=434235 RepID=A0ACC0YVE5_9ROSI|nr:hypothetical protein Pint_28718 [Pistacia integerrima]
MKIQLLIEDILTRVNVNGPIEAIDIHHIFVRRSWAKRFFIYLSVIVVLSKSLFLLLSKDQSIPVLLWSFILSGFFIKLLLWKPVEKETVIIMPALGVQLETHYLSQMHLDSLGSKFLLYGFSLGPESDSVVFLPHANMINLALAFEANVVETAEDFELFPFVNHGRIIRQFFPLDKILRPVLLECVTPITCYWSLSLVVRDEGELMLVFQELRPPVKMLVPIWKALCATIDDKKGLDTDDGS